MYESHRPLEWTAGMLIETLDGYQPAGEASCLIEHMESRRMESIHYGVNDDLVKALDDAIESAKVYAVEICGIFDRIIKGDNK